MFFILPELEEVCGTLNVRIIIIHLILDLNEDVDDGCIRVLQQTETVPALNKLHYSVGGDVNF